MKRLSRRRQPHLINHKHIEWGLVLDDAQRLSGRSQTITQKNCRIYGDDTNRLILCGWEIRYTSMCHNYRHQYIYIDVLSQCLTHTDEGAWCIVAHYLSRAMCLNKPTLKPQSHNHSHANKQKKKKNNGYDMCDMCLCVDLWNRMGYIWCVWDSHTNRATQSLACRAVLWKIFVHK